MNAPQEWKDYIDLKAYPKMWVADLGLVFNEHEIIHPDTWDVKAVATWSSIDLSYRITVVAKEKINANDSTR